MDIEKYRLLIGELFIDTATIISPNSLIESFPDLFVDNDGVAITRETGLCDGSPQSLAIYRDKTFVIKTIGTGDKNDNVYRLGDNQDMDSKVVKSVKRLVDEYVEGSQYNRAATYIPYSGDNFIGVEITYPTTNDNCPTAVIINSISSNSK